MVIQILKIHVTDFYHKKKITDDLFKKILLIQENVSDFVGYDLGTQKISVNPTS